MVPGEGKLFGIWGSLASINNAEEDSEIERLPLLWSEVWLGGTKENNSQAWEWSDGSAWNFTNWRSGYPKENKCIMKRDGKSWQYFSCNSEKRYVCRYNIEELRGEIEQTIKYNETNFPLPGIHITFHHPVMLSNGPINKIPGFKLKWHVEGTNTSNTSNFQNKWTNLIMYEGPKFSFGSTGTVLLEIVVQTRKQGISKDQLIKRALLVKSNMLTTSFKDSKKECKNGQLSKSEYHKLVAFFKAKLGLSSKAGLSHPDSDDIITSLELHFTQSQCSKEALTALEVLEDINHIPEHANYSPARMKKNVHAIFGHFKFLKI